MTTTPLLTACGDTQHWLSPLVGWLRLDQAGNTPTSEEQITIIVARTGTALLSVQGAGDARLHAAVLGCQDAARTEQERLTSGNPVDQAHLINTFSSTLALARQIEKTLRNAA